MIYLFKKRIIHPYRHPTLQCDHLFISSISQPPSSDFRPASSQSRALAMMLWATLYWYFQQTPPEPQIDSPAASRTAHAGKPKGEWTLRINREGVFKGRVILPKLERMGLIASLDSAVGVDRDERAGEGWLEMFVSRRSFWQLDARIYLFTLAPGNGSPYASGTPVGGMTPVGSRPGSPTRGEERKPDVYVPSGTIAGQIPAISNVLSGSGAVHTSGTSSPGPFTSASHLPTYYPPPTQTHHHRYHRHQTHAPKSQKTSSPTSTASNAPPAPAHVAFKPSTPMPPDRRGKR